VGFPVLVPCYFFSLYFSLLLSLFYLDFSLFFGLLRWRTVQNGPLD